MAEPEAATDRVPEAPTGWQRFVWLGPGFLWMISAAGSGELLFTPRVAAQYGYALLWALIAAVVLKWFINREIGRYAVCTGEAVLDGFRRLPGPRNWALWVILVPQLFVAGASIAGLASGAATALILVLPGDIRLWTTAAILASTALVLYGRYKAVETVAKVLAVALALAALVAAVSVAPQPGDLAQGLVPSMPEDVDYAEILPWLGYMLSGAAGMMWYSYWLRAKGYGPKASVDPKRLSDSEQGRLKGWLRQMSFDTTVAVIGALLVTLAFLILGAELLRPRGLVPEENKVAETLGHLLGGVWGVAGYWFMIVGVFVGFWDTVLSDQDGFGRLFANGTRHIAKAFGRTGAWVDEEKLKKWFVIILVTLVPILLFLLVGQPVGLLKLSGAIEAAHIPFVTALILYVNSRSLPAELKATRFSFAMTILAGTFFAAFAVFHLFTLVTQ